MKELRSWQSVDLEGIYFKEREEWEEIGERVGTVDAFQSFIYCVNEELNRQLTGKEVWGKDGLAQWYGEMLVEEEGFDIVEDNIMGYFTEDYDFEYLVGKTRKELIEEYEEYYDTNW